MKKQAFVVLTALLVLALPLCGWAQFTFTNNNGAITITGYTGPGGALVIPGSINGLQVVSIGDGAFYACYGLTNVTIPDSVTHVGNYAFDSCSGLKNVSIGNSVASIGNRAFQYCSQLKDVTIPNRVVTIGNSAFYYCPSMTKVIVGNGVTSLGSEAFSSCSQLKTAFFRGNAPATNGFVFPFCPTVCYYLDGTSGWSNTYAGRPAYLWNPTISTNGCSFGVQSNGFCFNITGTPDIPIVVEAATNLASTNWTILRNHILTNGLICFSDPQWTNHCGRFYLVRSP